MKKLVIDINASLIRCRYQTQTNSLYCILSQTYRQVDLSGDSIELQMQGILGAGQG